MGHNLARPRLAPNQTLNAENIHKLFGYKTVWLLPNKYLNVSFFDPSCSLLSCIIGLTHSMKLKSLTKDAPWRNKLNEDFIPFVKWPMCILQTRIASSVNFSFQRDFIVKVSKSWPCHILESRGNLLILRYSVVLIFSRKFWSVNWAPP